MRNVLLSLVAMSAILCAVPLWSQQLPPAAAKTTAPAKAPAPRSSLLDLIRAGGPIGYTIILLSVAALALAVDYGMNLRTAKVLPPGLADRLKQRLQAGQLGEALKECQASDTPLGHVLTAGLNEVDGGWPLVEKAMEDALADQAARMSRRIDYLSVIGNIAPMLGLLGTVTGMIEAFQTVAETQGVARAADLAKGIYEALVTTVEGLVVAIPCLGLYAFFRNRVDQLMSETAIAAQQAVLPLRRARLVARSGAKPPPLEGGGS